jgi:hypothetical protein
MSHTSSGATAAPTRTEPDPFPVLTPAQTLAKEVALRLAMIDSMSKLSLDEQYVMGLAVAELRAKREGIIKNIYAGLDIPLSTAAFARRCLVEELEAFRRLDAAAHSLFRRTISAEYPSGKGTRKVQHGECWFTGLATGGGNLTLHMAGGVARRLLMALAVVDGPVDEDAEMIGKLLGASELVGAVLVRPAVKIIDSESDEALARRATPFVVPGYPVY